MLELPTVTLVCIDFQQPTLALAAIEQSMIRCRFGGVVYVSDKPTKIDGLDVVEVPDLAAPGALSRFLSRDLATHVASPHALLIGWDAFVINPDAWTDSLLEHDVVMARRRPAMPAKSAESTGLVLLSRSLLQRLGSCALPDKIDGGMLDQAHNLFLGHTEAAISERFGAPTHRWKGHYGLSSPRYRWQYYDAISITYENPSGTLYLSFCKQRGEWTCFSSSWLPPGAMF